MALMAPCTWNHQDCFAFNPSRWNCRCLKDSSFPGREDCPFYKTREDYLKGIGQYGGLRKESE